MNLDVYKVGVFQSLDTLSVFQEVFRFALAIFYFVNTFYQDKYTGIEILRSRCVGVCLCMHLRISELWRFRISIFFSKEKKIINSVKLFVDEKLEIKNLNSKRKKKEFSSAAVCFSFKTNLFKKKSSLR